MCRRTQYEAHLTQASGGFWVSGRFVCDKADTETSLLPADRITIRQDNMVSTDTGRRGDVMSLNPSAINSS